MKRAFTLMELLVSVVLIGLITLYMYGAIASSRQTSKTLSRHALSEQNRTMLYTLFYRDLIEALRVKARSTKNKHFTVVQLQTRNSLYDIAAPHVTWYVNAQTHDLIRLESAQPIELPVNYERKHFIHADIFARDVTDFNLYTAMNESNSSVRAASSSASSIASLSSEEDAHRDNVRKQDAKDLSNLLFLFLKDSRHQPILLEIAR